MPPPGGEIYFSENVHRVVVVVIIMSLGVYIHIYVDTKIILSLYIYIHICVFLRPVTDAVRDLVMLINLFHNLNPDYLVHSVASLERKSRPIVKRVEGA